MDCLFCNIASKKINSDIIYEDDDLLIFSDNNPQAPIHKLIIPRKHIATINHLETEDNLLMGKMIQAAKHTAQQLAINENGYRLVFNTNHDAGQEVFHIHLHLLGGRLFTWPPG